MSIILLIFRLKMGQCVEGHPPFTRPPVRPDGRLRSQPQVVFRGAAALALFHLIKMGSRNAAAAGDLGLGQAGFLECFAEGLREEVEQRDEVRFLLHGGGSVMGDGFLPDWVMFSSGKSNGEDRTDSTQGVVGVVGLAGSFGFFRQACSEWQEALLVLTVAFSEWREALPVLTVAFSKWQNGFSVLKTAFPSGETGFQF